MGDGAMPIGEGGEKGEERTAKGSIGDVRRRAEVEQPHVGAQQGQASCHACAPGKRQGADVGVLCGRESGKR